MQRDHPQAYVSQVMLAALIDLAGQLIMRVLPLVVLFDLASGLSRLWLFFGFGTAAIGIGVAGAVTWHSATDPNGQQSKLDLATNAFLFWPHNFFFAVTYFVGANKDDYQSAQKAPQHGQAAVSAAPQLTALASWGGLVRLLAAFCTPEKHLSRSDTSGSAWRFRQPVPRAPMYLPLAVQALTESRGIKLSAAHAVFTACCCAFASLVAQKPRFAYTAAGVGCGLMVLGRCVPQPNPYPDPDPDPDPNPNPNPSPNPNPNPRRGPRRATRRRRR